LGPSVGRDPLRPGGHLVAPRWGSLLVEVELPFGTSGTFMAPTPASSVAIDGDPAEATVALAPGRHAIEVSAPRIAARR
ncbi:MAG: hypothetical protein PVH07_10490, partial [Chloroflexota bacterium]